MSDETWVAVAANVPVVPPVGMETDAGTDREALPETNVTTAPPAGAAADRVAVQVADPGVAIAEGVQLRPESCELPVNAIEVLCETPLAEAVTVAVADDVIVPAVAGKLVEALPAGTVTDGGTVSCAELDVKVTASPAAGAALLSETVQLAAPPEVRAEGTHETLETSAGDAAADSVMEKLRVVPL